LLKLLPICGLSLSVFLSLYIIFSVDIVNPYENQNVKISEASIPEAEIRVEVDKELTSSKKVNLIEILSAPESKVIDTEVKSIDNLRKEESSFHTVMGSENGGALELSFDSLSYPSDPVLMKIDPEVVSNGSYYQIDTRSLMNVNEGNDIELMWRGKLMAGKFTYTKKNQKHDDMYFVLDFENEGGRLTMQLTGDYIVGRFRDTEQAYHIDGYKNEIVLVDLVEYKSMNDAFKHD